MTNTCSKISTHSTDSPYYKVLGWLFQLIYSHESEESKKDDLWKRRSSNSMWQWTKGIVKAGSRHFLRNGLGCRGLYLYIDIYVCMYVCMCKYIHTHLYVCIYINICMCVYTYTYMYTYTCITNAKPFLKILLKEFSLWLRGLRTQHSVCEDVGSIPGLAQWVND